MNKVEANKYLLDLAEVRKQHIDSDSKMLDEVKAILMGAKALELVAKMEQDYEALEQQPCEDCISRQAVLEVLKKNRYRFNISQEGYWAGKILWSENLIKDDAYKEIEQLPSVTPKEKTGHWVAEESEDKE